MRICALVLLAAIFGGGCSMMPSMPTFISSVPPQQRDALYYFQKGEQELESGDDLEAIKNWEKVRESFTSSELNALAQLKIADTQYANERYIEAIAGYEDYLKEYPDSIRKNEVLFKLGMSHFHQILPEDRDQSATHNALAAFEQLQNNNPTPAQREQLKQLIKQCRDRLAANAAYIGKFYLKTKHYKAAINRLEEVRSKYPDYSDMAHVLLDLAQAYNLRGDRKKAAELFDVVISYHNPDFTEEANKLRNKAE